VVSVFAAGLLESTGLPESNGALIGSGPQANTRCRLSNPAQQPGNLCGFPWPYRENFG
jgi:hypothetical protein